MTEENAPTAPDSLPKYLRKGMPNQDVDTLHDVIDYAEELIEFQQRPVLKDAIPNDAETVEDDDESSGWAYTRTNTCGDETCHCYDGEEHGPYRYVAYRDENGDVTHEYQGKV